MTLTDQHIAFISNNLDFYGLKNNDLKEDQFIKSSHCRRSVYRKEISSKMVKNFSE